MSVNRIREKGSRERESVCVCASEEMSEETPLWVCQNSTGIVFQSLCV